MKKVICAAAIAALSVAAQMTAQDADTLQKADAPPNGIWVDALDLSNAAIRRPRAQRGQAAPAAPLVFRLGGVTYSHGVPLQSDGDLTIDLGAAATRFVSMIGIDDGAPLQPGAQPGPPGSVVFAAWVDGKKVFESDVMKRGDAARPVSIDLTGAKKLVLAVVDGNDGTAGDNADWAGAALIAAPGQQAQIHVAAPAVEAPPPIAPAHASTPAINYPRITGATPGRPFLFRIPAAGDGPLSFTARNLPAGLALDPATGVIRGALKQ